MRTLALLLAALLGGAALAGCTNGDDVSDPTPTTMTPEATPAATPDATPPTATPPTATPPTVTPPVNATPGLDGGSFVLASVGVPTQAKPNATVGFTLYVNGTASATSEHIGAHYADNDTTSPPGAGRRDCAHAGGSLPGVFNVSCTFPATGAWHVFGHAQVNESGTLLNWWAQPFVVRVRDYNLTLAGVPATATDDTNFSFVLNVTALGLSDNATSDHIGAHYFNNTTDSTTETSAGACEHTAGGVVGPHSVTCSIDQGSGLSREVYVRGHIRIVEGATTLSWWSEPVKVTISALGGVGLPDLP